MAEIGSGEQPKLPPIPKTVINKGASPEIFQRVLNSVTAKDVSKNIASAKDPIQLENIVANLPPKLKDDPQVQAEIRHRSNILKNPR